MTVKNWRAKLNHGGTVNESTPVNEPLQWKKPHWKQETNCLSANEVSICQEGDFDLCRINLALEIPDFQEAMSFAAEDTLEITLKLPEKIEKITAFYQFNDWWIRSAFCNSLQEMPDRTGILLCSFKKAYGCLLAFPGDKLKPELAGGLLLFYSKKPVKRILINDEEGPKPAVCRIRTVIKERAARSKKQGVWNKNSFKLLVELGIQDRKTESWIGWEENKK